MKQEENKRSPREFYDQEKEVIGRPDTEVDAIIRDIYRSAVYGEKPEQRRPQRPAEETQIWQSSALEEFWKDLPKEKEAPKAQPQVQKQMPAEERSQRYPTNIQRRERRKSRSGASV